MAAVNLAYQLSFIFTVYSYLAHEMQEDWDLFKNEITPWFPVDGHESNVDELTKMKNDIWSRIDYEGFVSKESCDDVSYFT